MSIVPSLIYLPSLIGILLVALATFISRNARGAGYFSVFSVTMALWLLPQYIAQATDGRWHALTILRIATILSLLSAFSFLLFIYSYTQSKKLTAKRITVLSFPAIAIACFGFSNFVIRGVDASASGIAINEVGPGYFIVITFAMLYLIYGFYLLLAATAKIPQSERSKNYALVIGLAQAMTLSALSSTIFANNQIAQFLIPLSLFIMSIIVSFTIIKHRLFNIQLLIARTLAYILVLAVSAAGFSFIIFGGSSVLSDGKEIPLPQQLLYTSAALILAFVLPILKKYFDRVTNRLFYRDAYDPQAFIDEFNKILVSTYDLTPLLRRGAQTIQNNLKASYILFGIRETETTPRRIIGTPGHPTFQESAIAYVRSQTVHMNTKVIVADQLDEKHEQLQQIMQSNQIDIIARLISRTKAEEGAGYLIIGPKKSGNSYSAQDLKIIEIIANESVIAIQNALRTEEIQQFNITLQEKVNDATRKLRRTNEKLKAMDETKDDFISMASHQLRTPLTSVKGYISMVLEEDAGKITPTQRDMLGQAFFSSQRMVYLIADLLNVSRLKTGKFIIERAPIQLDQIVQQELRQLQETAAARSLTLQFDKPDTFPSMMLDETKTRQIIMNFIDNAIYYTPAGGHIKVRLLNKENSVELRVEDDGIGVPKAEQQHLFTKFYRAGNARQARPDGTGLGLYMAKKVIVAQGGALLFESTENKGSTFGFIFSKSLAADTPAVAPTPVIPVQAVKEVKTPKRELAKTK